MLATCLDVWEILLFLISQVPQVPLSLQIQCPFAQVQLWMETLRKTPMELETNAFVGQGCSWWRFEE